MFQGFHHHGPRHLKISSCLSPTLATTSPIYVSQIGEFEATKLQEHNCESLEQSQLDSFIDKSVSELVEIFAEIPEFDDMTTEQRTLAQDFLRDAHFEDKTPMIAAAAQNDGEFSENVNFVDDCTFENVLSGDECETNAAENMPPREACSHPCAITFNSDPRSFKKSRKRRRGNEDSDFAPEPSVSAEFMDFNAFDECEMIAAEKMLTREDCSHFHAIKSNADSRSFKKSRKCRRGHEDSGCTRARSVSVQCMDCKTKNVTTRGRHDNIDNNVMASTPNKYYRQLDIVVLSDHQTQLQNYIQFRPAQLQEVKKAPQRERRL